MSRPATSNDLEFVHRLYMHESINPFISYDRMSLEEFAPEFQQLRDQTRVLIYEMNGTGAAIGTVQRGTHRMRHSAHLGGIAVDPDLQLQGVGTRFVTELLDELRDEGVIRVELCVSADNPRGIGFYEKLGFEKEGLLKRFFSREGHEGYFDEYAMAKFLD